jgi:hypothetical protein
MLLGTAMLLACAVIALAGISVAHVWTALLVRGMGWTCLYGGATALLTTTYGPAGKAKAQGATEFACDTAVGATHLVALYLRMGFEIVGEADFDSTNYKSHIFVKRI